MGMFRDLATMKGAADSKRPFISPHCHPKHGVRIPCDGKVVIREGGKPKAVACECGCHTGALD